MDMQDLLKKKAALDELIKSQSQKVRTGVDEGLQEYVNQPLADAGYPNLGAGVSAIGSAATEYVTPEDSTDLALSMIPGGKSSRPAMKAVASNAASEIGAMDKLYEKARILFKDNPEKLKFLENTMNESNSVAEMTAKLNSSVIPDAGKAFYGTEKANAARKLSEDSAKTIDYGAQKADRLGQLAKNEETAKTWTKGEGTSLNESPKKFGLTDYFNAKVKQFTDPVPEKVKQEPMPVQGPSNNSNANEEQLRDTENYRQRKAQQELDMARKNNDPALKYLRNGGR
jgi:hypothetical protein